MTFERNHPTGRPPGPTLVRVADPSALLSTGRKRRVDVAKPVRVDTAGVYARYSGFGQRESSIERQYGDADEYASRASLRIVRRHCDRARPGTTRVGREGLQRLLADARAGAFAVVIVEDIDRLARDVADLYAIIKELTATGVEVHESKSGRLEGIALAAKALIAAQARARFLWLCREGRRDAVWEGRIPHKVNYGYFLERRAGSLAPHPERAAVMRGLFEEAARGTRAHVLAEQLTGSHPTPADAARLDRGEPLPDGPSAWTSHSIKSLLRSPIYMGLLIDGRTVTERHPETGGVTHAPNAFENWDICYLPELDIVGAELWARTQGEISRHSFTTCTIPGRALFKQVACKGCGRAARRVGGHPYTQYRCSHADGTPDHAVPAGPLEAAILTAILDRCGDTSPATFDAGRNDPSAVARSSDEVAAEVRWSEDALHEALMASLLGGDRSDAAKAARTAEARVRELRAEYDRASGRVEERPRDPAEVASRMQRLLPDAGRGRLPSDPDAIFMDALVRSIEIDMLDGLVAVAIDVNADVLTTVASLPRLADEPLRLRATVSLAEVAAARRSELATEGVARWERRADELLRWARSVLDQVSATAGACFRDHGFAPRDFGWEEKDFLQTVLAISKGNGRRKELVRLGPESGFAEALRSAERSGVWRDLVPRLTAEHGTLLRGLRWTWQQTARVARRKVDVLRDVTPAVLEAVAREVASAVDPRHAARLRAVADRYAGASTRSVAKAHSVLERSVSAWLHLYRTCGPTALDCIDPSGDALIDLVVADFDERLGAPMSDKLRKRLLIVQGHLSGWSRTELAKEHGTTYSDVADCISIFDWGSIAAFEGRVSRKRFSAHHLEEIRALVKLGVDPDDPGKPLTFAALVRVCATRFGMDVPRHALMTSLHRAGIHLNDREAAPASVRSARSTRTADLGLMLKDQDDREAEAA